MDGAIVEDPEAGPIIREIFRLYSTGDYSVRLPAEHLNNNGVRPHRGPNKAKHNRPAGVIFTGDVLKDILGNAAYWGKVMVDGELIEGGYAALVDEATWQACANVRSRNQRRTSNTWTRHKYPLTPLRMHGEVSKKRGHEDLYYACNNARRRHRVVPRTAL